MLVGTIKFKVGIRDDLSPKYETFEFEGVDSSTCLYGRLLTHSYSAIDLMAGVYDSDSLWERRININLSSVKVEVETYKDETTGKNVKKPVNYEFFCKLGALIRYAKSKCQKKYAMGYTGLKLASGEYVPESEITYVIPLDKKNDSDEDRVLGTVVLCLGEIKELHISTNDFVIDIEEDKSREMTVFYDIKNSTPKGFKFDEETLGFYIAPQVVEKVNSSNGMYTCLEDIIKNNPEKEYSWLLDNKYIIVSDDMLEEVCEYIRNWDGFVYYDTETTGLNITFKSRIGQADQLVGVVLSVKYGESFFFPVQMKSIPNLCNSDHWYFMEHYMRPILEGKKLVAHNMSYDWKVAYIYDINANIVHDTMALFKLTLGAEKENFPMGLKELAKMFLHRDSLELSDLVIDDSWGESDIKFWDLPYELVRLYACADTDNTKGLLDYALSNDLLAQYNATRVYEIEIAFSFAVSYQEFMGHKIDSDNLEGLRTDVEAGIKENMDKMVEIVGYEFNPNSPPQLLKIMYDPVEQGGQGIPVQISRKTGRPTTDKETLKYLSELTDIEGNIKYPFVHYLQEYRTYEGVRKIIDQFPDLATEDGYLFSSVMQYGTTTGRVSINKPNYQSYNNTVKKYVVPRPGFYMTDSDYSSVEYRVLGNMSGNTMIKEGFVDPDFDYHAYQAARMYNVPYAAVTKTLRKAAKGINFGLPYGMGDESLGVRVFGEASQENTRKAASLRQKYFEGQEDIRDFFETARANGVNNGYTETYFGRRRYYHRNKFSVNAIRRQAGNQVIQGTAADIYKLAVGRLFKRICKEGWLGKVLLIGFIHDEVLCEVHNSIDPMTWLKVLREEFEVKIEGWCPLYMGFGFGMSWYEAKSVELPIKLQWELVNNYGDDGYPKWKGDGYELCAEVPEILRDFSVRDTEMQLLDEDSQGKVIKPTLNNAVFDVLSDDRKAYELVINDYEQSLFQELSALGEEKFLEINEGGILAELEKHHIKGLYRKDGKIQTTFEKTKDTQQAIDDFCMLHGVDRSKVNLENIPDAGASMTEGSDDVVYDNDFYDEDSVFDKQKAIDTRIDTFGLYLDTDEGEVLLKVVPDAYMQFIRQHANVEGKGYRIKFKDCEKKLWLETKCYIESEDINIIQQMYIKYFTSLARV